VLIKPGHYRHRLDRIAKAHHSYAMNRQSGTRPLWLLLAYGCIAMPLSTIGLPLSIYLAPFYAGELGLPLAALGTVMVLARLIDVVVDPVVGIVSDRWRPSVGRRKIWLPIGVALLAVGSWMLFQPGAKGVGIGYFFLWTTIMYLGFTATKLPYDAWGAELLSDYKGRTRVASFRQAFSLIGLVVATVIPALILMQKGNTAADVLRGMSWIILGLLPLCALLAFIFVPDTSPAEKKSGASLWQQWRPLWRNGPFRRIALAMFIGYIAETARVTITLFFARDAIGVSNIGAVYVYYFIAGLVGVPIWSALGNRLGKHRALALAFALLIMINGSIFFLKHGQEMAFTILFIAKGLCFGALELLPAAMIADTVDVDAARTRKQRQGLYFAVIGILVKFGQALGQGLSLNLLDLAGYKAAGGNGAEAIHMLKLLYAMLPNALLLISIWLIWHYPLTAIRHARLRSALERRAALNKTER
jgi:glycoside/pentoside/hexuronide:cation symporter, GPH family